MNPEWPLILFTFFLCLSGGILGAQGLLTVLGKGKKMQNVALIAALATLVIGGICVFMHLQHWERIFNAFGALLAGNGYGVSGITLELWGCVVEFIAIALFFLFAAAPRTASPRSGPAFWPSSWAWRFPWSPATPI